MELPDNIISDPNESEGNTSVQTTPSPERNSTEEPIPGEMGDLQFEDFNNIDIDALIAEADRKLSEMKRDPNILSEIAPFLERTKYSKTVSKISKLDSKLRALSMRDKALKRHSRAVKALLEAGKLEEAEDLAVQIPGNEMLDEECTDLDGGIFYQTELNSKPELHLPRIITQGPLNLVRMESEPEVRESDLVPLTEEDIERLEAILDKDSLSESKVLLSEEDINRMEEINSELEIYGHPVYVQDSSNEKICSTVEDIMSRQNLSEQFVSLSRRQDLERIDTALDILKSKHKEDLAPAEKIEAVISQIDSTNN